MIGAIIGAGIFGLPAVFVRVGFLPGTILFAGLAVLVTITHLFFAEQLLSIRERHRLAWLAKHSLGETASWIATLTYPTQIIAANFAYLILGGEFLAAIANAAGIHFPVGVWQLLFWIAGASTVYLGLKMMANVNAYATSAKLAALLFAVIVVSGNIEFTAIKDAHWGDWYLPFGVFLFTLSGLASVGEVVEIAGRKRSDALFAVGVGTVLSAAISWLFGTAVYLGAHGYPIRTTSELISVLPVQYALLVPALGFLAVATAYMVSAEDLKHTLSFDFGLSKMWAAVIGLGTPLVMLAFLPRDFLATISFAGAVLIGINSILVCLIALNGFSRQKKTWIRVGGSLLSAGICFVFLFGIIQNLLSRYTL